MDKYWKQIKEKWLGGKKPGKDQFLIMILFGILLLIIALPTDTGGKDTTSKDDGSITNTDFWQSLDGGTQKEKGETKTANSYDITSEEEALDLYTRRLEEKVKTALAKMDQVGDVEVVITMASSIEKIVEKDVPMSRDNMVEEDGDGGKRNTNSVETGEATVYETTEGNGSVPYVVKTIQPQVEGVMVVAQGAGQGNVSKNITEAIQVLFGIEAHKIKVVKMKTN